MSFRGGKFQMYKTQNSDAGKRPGSYFLMFSFTSLLYLEGKMSGIKIAIG